MNTYHLKTDLSCESCKETLKAVFKNESEIDSWDVDLKAPGKTLTVRGSISESGITRLIEKAGYHVLGRASNHSEKIPTEELRKGVFKTYYPLILIFSYILGFTLLRQFSTGGINVHETMIDFMGGFFAVFSFFKLLNLKGFIEAYSTYDVIAKRSQIYGYIYPFLELSLGIAYLARFNLTVTMMFTLVLMSVSSIGVIQAVNRKTKIQCACLGTIFNLPMTYITLFEDLLMAGMALFSLVYQT